MYICTDKRRTHTHTELVGIQNGCIWLETQCTVRQVSLWIASILPSSNVLVTVTVIHIWHMTMCILNRSATIINTLYASFSVHLCQLAIARSPFFHGPIVLLLLWTVVFFSSRSYAWLNGVNCGNHENTHTYATVLYILSCTIWMHDTVTSSRYTIVLDVLCAIALAIRIRKKKKEK